MLCTDMFVQHLYETCTYIDIDDAHPTGNCDNYMDKYERPDAFSRTCLSFSNFFTTNSCEGLPTNCLANN